MTADPLQALFEQYTGQTLAERTEINASGSNRRYFRLKGGRLSVVGVIGTSFEENRAFIGLSRHFKDRGMPVPAVLAVSEDGMAYIQEDLGDQLLYNITSASCSAAPSRCCRGSSSAGRRASISASVIPSRLSTGG